MPVDFCKTFDCTSGAHCATCRSRGADGQEFRADRARLGEVASPDFDCPYGKEWGFVPQPGGIVHGAIGVAKAVLHLDRAPDAVIEARRAVCAGGCPHAVLTLGVLSRCALCGCATALKLRVASESCPVGRWGPAPAPGSE